ncbi:MAG: hypothetical protein H6699_02705 [Myxococcales bacterium]|nr:hypothetical protein [Myxococcales bacterium]
MTANYSHRAIVVWFLVYGIAGGASSCVTSTQCPIRASIYVADASPSTPPESEIWLYRVLTSDEFVLECGQRPTALLRGAHRRRAVVASSPADAETCEIRATFPTLKIQVGSSGALRFELRGPTE